MDQAQLRQHISGKTAVTYMGMQHGTQIEYLDPDGGAHLWYPGNRIVLHGEWKIDSVGTGSGICYRYGANTYNPATGQSGGSWQCSNAHNSEFFVVDRVTGDPFQLRSADAVPSILEKEAVRPFIPGRMPFERPHLTNGKTPMENLYDVLGVGQGT